MNCIIVDDEAAARAILRKHCDNIPDLDVLDDFSNAMEALKFLNKQQVDLIFLDIHMPGFNGFDFIETLKDAPKIVLITSDANFALTSYEYEAVVDYLVKPLSEERFEKSMEKVRKALSAGPSQKDTSKASGLGEELYVNIDRRLIKIRFEDIQLIEAQGDYIQVKTDKDNIRVHNTLKSIREKLPQDIFLQIHRSFIINLTKIIDIEDNSVLIEKSVIPISRANRPELMRRLNLL
jgi:two-component system response regulator LytT